jgi:four helix bundle protein
MPHKRLEAWKTSMQLVQLIYKMTAGFPSEERFGLSQQMRRAAVSVPSNIAEGAARSGSKEYAHFIAIARGSLAELDTQIRIANMLGFSSDNAHAIEKCTQTGKLLTGLYRKWNDSGRI